MEYICKSMCDTSKIYKFENFRSDKDADKYFPPQPDEKMEPMDMSLQNNMGYTQIMPDSSNKMGEINSQNR